jgi:hypothetical protein
LPFINLFLALTVILFTFSSYNIEPAGRNKIGWMETQRLKNRLVRLYKTGGSEKEIKELRETLMENGLSAPELERDQLIFSVSTDYAERLALNRGQEYHAILADARSLGLSDVELGLKPWSALSRDEQLAMAERLINSTDLYESNRLSWRLSQQALATETQQIMLDAIPRNSSPKGDMLLSTLQKSKSELMDQTFERWAADTAIDRELRLFARRSVIAQYAARKEWSELLSITKDSALPDEDRLSAIRALLRGEKRKDPSFKETLLSLAQCSKESAEVRRKAISALDAAFTLSKDEVKVIEDVLDDAEAPPSVRFQALMALNVFRGVRTGDETWLKYMTKDPSFAFRKQLADALKGCKTFVAGDAVREAIEEIQKESAVNADGQKE